MRETTKPRPQGYVFYRETTGKWYARLTYIVKETGNRREIIRTARDEDHANQILADLVASFAQIREQSAPQLPPEPIVSAPDDYTLPPPSDSLLSTTATTRSTPPHTGMIVRSQVSAVSERSNSAYTRWLITSETPLSNVLRLPASNASRLSA